MFERTPIAPSCRTRLDRPATRSIPAVLSFSLWWAAAGFPAEPGSASGKVLFPDGSPASGARVRLQAADDFVLSGLDGAFSLDGISGPGKVTAGLEGYRNSFRIASPGDTALEIRLGSLPDADHPEYVWEPPLTCVQCHAQNYQEWLVSPLARSLLNPAVLALYRGTRFDGSPSEGFGYRKAHPESYGDCAFCHVPAFAARSDDPRNDLDPHHDLEKALSEGTEAERGGVICDFCHKVRSVEPGGMPPRRGEKFSLLRPPQFEPLMFGPLDDVTFVGMGAAYSPFHEKTADLCSLCHWHTNRNGVTVLSQFVEWRDGPYPAQGKRCPDCHMKPDGTTDFFCLWEPVYRNPATIYMQSFRGIDESHLSEALTLEVSAQRQDGPEGSWIDADVGLTNSGAGHSVPSGITLRQVLLVVEARRASGYPLDLLEGPRLPSWAGEGGSPENGYLAGLPGKGFARIVTDGKTERVFDTEATAVVSDNRIAPLASDRSSYRFDLKGYRGPVEVRARAIHRRWWKDLADERGFPGGDSPMTEKTALVPGEPAVFIRGDGDGSGALDISDAVYLLGHLFSGDPRILPCPDAADADDSGVLDLTDAILVLGYLFLGESPPPAPFPKAGIDPTQDKLEC